MKRTPLQRKTPLRNTKPLYPTTPPDRATRYGSRPLYERPDPAPLDFDAARRAMQKQAESAATPRREHAPVPEVSQRAPKPSNTGFPTVTRQTILERDNYTCWRCTRPVDVVGGSLQHRDNRGQGGTSDPRINWTSNGLTLCGDGTTGCHGWVEKNPTDAARMGWAVESWADPETVPVRHARLGWFLLDRNGFRRLTAAPPNNDAHTVARRKTAMR